jgi:hypothetical protein
MQSFRRNALGSHLRPTLSIKTQCTARAVAAICKARHAINRSLSCRVAAIYLYIYIYIMTLPLYIYIYIYRQGLSVYPLKSVGPESFQKGVQAAREGHAGPTARSRAQAPQCPVNSDANRSVQLARFAAVTIYIYTHVYRMRFKFRRMFFKNMVDTLFKSMHALHARILI